MSYTPKILIVDDNVENLRVVGNILKSENYDIAVSLNGERAINILLNNEIDLILMDLMMPEMDGIETCKKIKHIEFLREIPLIFLTAKTQTSDVLEAFEAGGVDYILKPFNRMELLARVQTHLDLYLSKQQLKELYRNRDLIYSIIAHDIKSPFNKISQVLNMLNEAYLSPNTLEFNELLDLINQETDKTVQLINELIDWGKIQVNDEHNQLIPITIKPIADSVITFLEHQFHAKSIRVTNEIEDGIKVIGNEKSIQVILRNILSNAIKFTPNEGLISLMSNDLGNKVCISIIDSGTGMEEEVLEKLFVKNEFYKTNGTNKEIGHGFGIQIIKDLIKKNKAELRVTSKKNEGTTFSFIIDKYI